MVFKNDKFIVAIVLTIFAIFNVANADTGAEKFVPEGVKNTKPTPNNLITTDYLTEGFETWFPTGWTHQIQNASYTWFQTFASSYEGIASAQIEYDPALTPQDEWMITPTLDFTNAGSDVHVSFWWFTSYYWHVDPYDNADMEVLISLDNGVNWQPALWCEDDYGVFQNFSWYQSDISLSSYTGYSEVKLGFRYVGSDGAQANFDAILIADSGPGLGHNVGPTGFQAPGATGNANDPIIPQVTYANTGSNTETFDTRLLISFNSSTVYDETVNIASLAPGNNSDATYPSYTPASEGIYTLTAISLLVGDENNADDTLIMDYSTIPFGGYFEDFESGNGGFTGDNDWQHGTPTTGPGSAHSGVNVWGTLINGTYTVGPLLSSLTSPSIDIGDNATLSFWHYYHTESAYDGGNVKISTDGGTTWSLITPAGGYDGTLNNSYLNPIGGEDAFYGNSGGWTEETFDLSSIASGNIMLKFDYGSDNSLQVGDGWYIDDVYLEFQVTDIEDETVLIPVSFDLSQNYPNPFNAVTSIDFTLPKAADVNLSIYNVLGQKITTIISGNLEAGVHQVIWDASDQATGIYFYRIEAGDFNQTKKMVYLK